MRNDLKKLQLLSVIIIWEKWKELKKYDEFFSSLTENELDTFEQMVMQFEFDVNNTLSTQKKSMLKPYKEILKKLAAYVIECGEIDEEESRAIISLL